MKFLNIIIVLTCLSCTSAQNEKNELIRDPDALMGRWELQKKSNSDQVFFDISDKTKLIKDSLRLYNEKGVQYSEIDSLRIVSNIDTLLKLMKNNYLIFGQNEQIIASVFINYPNTPLTYTLEGIFEVDFHKLRIEFEEHEYPLDPSGSYHWYIKNQQLFLIRNYNDANEMTYIYKRTD